MLKVKVKKCKRKEYKKPDIKDRHYVALCLLNSDGWVEVRDHSEYSVEILHVPNTAYIYLKKI